MSNAKRITSAAGRFSNSTVTNDDNSFKQQNVADYTVKKKVEGRYKLNRFLYIVILFAVIIGTIVIMLSSGSVGGLVIICMIAIIPLLTWILVYYTWRYFSIEYSYAIENGELIVTTIYGEKSDKLMLRIKMNQVEAVAPYSGEYKAAAQSTDIKSRIEAVSSFASPDTYYAIYKDDADQKNVLFFEGTNKSLKAFKYYNSQNTIIGQTRR